MASKPGATSVRTRRRSTGPPIPNSSSCWKDGSRATDQGLLLLGLNRSARPPDAEYPLGHGRAIYFWSFIVALMLFSMGGMFSIYEGIAVGIAMLTGNPYYDALGSLAIGVLLLVVAVCIGIEVKALLVGQSAAPALQEEIRRFVTAREEVAEVLSLITLQNGADVVVAVKARMTESVSAPAMVAAINRCERALRAAFPQVRWLFFEPDVEK